MDRFGPEVTEYVRLAVEMFAVDDADIVFLVLPEGLSTPMILGQVTQQIGLQLEARGITDRLIVCLPHGTVPYGVEPMNQLRTVE